MLSIGDSRRRIPTMHPDLQEGESLQVAPTRLKHNQAPFLKAVGHRQNLSNRWLILRPAQLYVNAGLLSGTSRAELLAQAHLDNGNDSIHDVASTLMRPSISMACSKILEPTWSTFKARMLTSTHISCHELALPCEHSNSTT